jgi:G2/mitotic-specific cyclin-B, other
LINPYMPNQKDINHRMRGILVDWLVEVHHKFRLQPPTLWLCINLMDRFLEKKSIVRNKLQLLGVTCLLIACKFEEIYPPEIRDCVYITDNAYSREEVLAMEQSVLLQLDYQLCVPTGYHFLTRYLILINASERLRHLAFYYAERNLQESVVFSHKPSHIVCAALYAALVHQSQITDSTLNRSGSHDVYSDDEEAPASPSVWPDLLIDETGLDEDDLVPIAKLLVKHVSEETVTSSQRHLIAAKKKYLNDKFLNVAELELPTIIC